MACYVLLNIFLCIFLSLTVNCKFNNNIFIEDRLISSLLEGRDNFIFCFHGNIWLPYFNYIIPHYTFIRQLVFSHTYHKTVNVADYISHYVQTSVIMFAQSKEIISHEYTDYDSEYQSTQVIFSLGASITNEKLLMATDSLLVLLNFYEDSDQYSDDICDFDTNSTWIYLEKSWMSCSQLNEFLLNTPVLKLQVKVSSSGISEYNRILCNGYCISVPENNINVSLKTRQDILQLHKSYFWNANNKEILTQIDFLAYTFYIDSSFTTKSFLCQEIYKSRQYIYLTDARYCWATQMIPIELSLLHNISYKMYTNKPKSFAVNYFLVNQPPSTIIYQWYGGLYLQLISGSYYYYCKYTLIQNTKYRIDFHVWTESVTLVVWLAILFLWVITAIVISVVIRRTTNFFKTFFNQLIFLFLVNTRFPIHINANYKRWYILSVFPVLFFWWMYEVSITSLVTVQLQPKPFGSLDELIANGFYLAAPRATESIYEIFRYRTAISESKPAFEFDAYKSKIYVKLMNIFFQRFYSPNMECFHTQEEVHVQPWFMVLYTVNRYWMVESLRRMYQGGLFNKWNDLAEFANANMERGLFKEPDHGGRHPDLITFNRVIAMFVVYGLLNSIALFIFIVERNNT